MLPQALCLGNFSILALTNLWSYLELFYGGGGGRGSMVVQTTEESSTHHVTMFIVMVVCLSAMNSVHCVYSYDSVIWGLKCIPGYQKTQTLVLSWCVPLLTSCTVASHDQSSSNPTHRTNWTERMNWIQGKKTEGERRNPDVNVTSAATHIMW